MTNGTKKLMFSFRTFNRTTTISYKCLMKFQNISPKNPYFTLTFLDMKGSLYSSTTLNRSFICSVLRRTL